MTHRSHALFQQAKQYITGGVNSPVRAFKNVGGDPLFIQSAQGAYVMDEDDNRYIDYVGSWGPMILGHNHPAVVDAVQRQAAIGMSYGAPTKLEIDLAEMVCEIMPSIERIRMVSSGTEATMTAIRLARGATHRDLMVKFIGGYHGHSDSLLVDAGSGAATHGVPSSPGVPAATAACTLTAPYNDLDATKALFEANPDDIACIIVEPVAGNMGCVPPAPGFLQGLRDLCDQYGALLIFDEVMTGFRVALGGAQERYQIKPDITTLGKIIGGGMPVGAIGGRRDLMEQLSPMGPIYQAGTLSGNPLAMAAGIATLTEIQKPDFYEKLEKTTSTMLAGISDAASSADINVKLTQVGSMFSVFFDTVEQFNTYFAAMLNHGVYLAPSAFESGFVSAEHGPQEIQATIKAAIDSMQTLSQTQNRRTTDEISAS